MRMIHINTDEYNQMRENYRGYCLECGGEQYNCEPDAREYTCESCGEPSVFGIEELLITGHLEIID